MAKGRPRKIMIEAEAPLSTLQLENIVDNVKKTITEVNNNDLRNEEKKEDKGQIVFVNMVRDNNWPEPHTATVHPDEVENYKFGGWVKK